MIEILSNRLGVRLNYFVSGGKWLVLAQVLNLLFSVAATVVVAGTLSPHDFGVYKYLVELGILLSFLSMSGLANAILQAAARKHDLLSQTRKLFLLSSLPVTTIGLILSGYYFFNNNIYLALGCVFIAVLQPIVQIFNNNQAFLNGSGDFKSSSLQRVYKSSLQCLFLILSAVLWEDGVIVFLTFLLVQSVFVIFNTIQTNKHTFDAKPIDVDRKRKYLTFAKHTSVRNLISGASQKVDALFLFQYLGSFELATFAVAMIIPEQLRGMVKNLQTLLIPKLAKKDSQSLQDMKFFKHLFNLFLILIGISFVMILITPTLIEVLLPKYGHAVLYTQILLLILPATASVLPVSLLQTLQANRELYIYHSSTACIQVVGSILSIIFYGLLGAIIFRVVTNYCRAAIAIILLLNLKRRNNTPH